MIGAILHNRYHIEEELGRGGMGVVYRAHDQLLNRPVAVKVISEEGMGSSGRARLLAEAQAVARLNHPNIVAVYDAGEAGNVAFLVMELVEGSSLRSLHDLSIPRALEIAIQICAALEQAHASGIIHRDLKPENIFITPSRTIKDSVNAKLMDFGLARRIEPGAGSEHLTQAGALVGTVAYIAPEIIRGEAAGPQSDLYALGLVLYEMLTGRPAYSGQDLIAILSQHLHATVEPPSTHNPAIPPDLEALILRLLEKLPEHRPASAGEVREFLEALRAGRSLEAPGGAVHRSGAQASPLDRIVRGRLVARDDELNELLAYWRRAAQGESRVVLVSGEPGIGKTRLVKELLTRAGLSGGKTLLGECLAHGGAPYAPIAQTIEQAVLGGESLDGLPPLMQADLFCLAPGLLAHYPMPPEAVAAAPALAGEFAQQRLYASYTGFCERLAERSPLLIVLDDAHWADRGSLDLLRHLARRAARARWRLMIVLTYREVELSESRALTEILADLNRQRLADGSPLSERVKLARFSQQQTGLLLASIFASPVSDDFRNSIYRETEGNPFFIEEVCKTLIEEGVIYRENGAWVRAAGGEIHLPQSVRLAIEGRIARLPEAVQDILRQAAVFGRRFYFDSLQQALGVDVYDEDALIDALDQAQRVQLIEEVGGGHGGMYVCSFTHALIPAALTESLSGLRRRRLHRKAIEVISRLHPEDYEALAHHSAEAADDAQALEYYIKAAQRAGRLYANTDAIRFYTEALALVNERDSDPAIQLQHFDLLAWRSEVYDLLARRDEQRADIDAMLTLAEKMGDRPLQAEALLRRADYFLSVDAPQAQGPAEQALALARETGDTAREGRALVMLGRNAMYHFDDDRCREFYGQAIERLRAVGMLAQAAYVLNWLALVDGRTGKHEKARQELEEAIAISRQIGDRRLEGVNLRRMATNLIYADKNADALPYAHQAVELHRQVGDRAQECHDLNVVGLCLLGLERLPEAGDYFLQSLALADEIELVLGKYNAVSNLVDDYYSRLGEYENALALLEERLKDQQMLEDPFMHYVLVSYKISMLTNLGQFVEAEPLIDEMARCAEQVGDPKWPVQVLYRRAYISMEAANYAEARRWIEQAQARAAELELAELHFHARWLTGGIAYRQGALEQALSIAIELEALAGMKELKPGEVAELHMLKAAALADLGCLAEALQAIQPVLAYLDEKKPTAHIAAYLVAAYVLHVAGQPAAADRLRPAYEQVMDIAGKITRAAQREAYLGTFVPGRVVKLWEDLET